MTLKKVFWGIVVVWMIIVGVLLFLTQSKLSSMKFDIDSLSLEISHPTWTSPFLSSIQSSILELVSVQSKNEPRDSRLIESTLLSLQSDVRSLQSYIHSLKSTVDLIEGDVSRIRRQLLR